MDIGGELDIATADMAVRYVSHVIDSRCGAVTVDLTALGFCDAAGLTALLRMVGYAQQAACPFCLASLSPSLIKIMRVTGLARRLLTPTCPQRAACLVTEDAPAAPGSAGQARGWVGAARHAMITLGYSPRSIGDAILRDPFAAPAPGRSPGQAKYLTHEGQATVKSC